MAQGQAPLTIAATASANLELIAQLQTQLKNLLIQLITLLQAKLTELIKARGLPITVNTPTSNSDGGGGSSTSGGSPNSTNNVNSGSVIPPSSLPPPPPPPPPSSLSPNPFSSIVIGVWYQSGDPATITKWKNRGVDTFIGPPTVYGNWIYSTFMNNLAAQGMKGIVMPSDAAAARSKVGNNFYHLRPDYRGYPLPTTDSSYPNFSAWLLEPDEPDLDTHMVGYPNAIDKNATVALWVSRAQYLRSLSPSTFQAGGFTGNDLSYVYNNGAKNQRTFTGLTWTDFELMAAPLDLVFSDYYPITVGADITKLVSRIVATAAIANGKPWGVFIEASDQHLAETGRAPTPAEFRAEIWLSLIHGAKGVFYFPQSVGGRRPPFGSRDDNTPPDIVAEMITQNALIKAEAANLMRPGEVVPLVAPFYRRLVTLTDSTKRAYTLNLSNLAQTLEGQTFMPYEVKIGAYNKPPMTVAPPVLVPSPDATPPVSPSLSSDITDGLILRLPFDGNTQDSSSNGNNGVVVGDPVYVTGKTGQALNFSSNGQSVRVSPSSPLNNLTVFTYSVWLNIQNPPQNYLGRIIAKDIRGSDSNGTLLQWNTGTFHNCHLDGVVGFSAINAVVTSQNFCPTGTVTLTGWHHLVFTLDDNKMPRLYLDGVEAIYQTQTAGSGVHNDDATGNLFVANSSYNTRTFNGFLDEVRIYNRALSVTEVQQLYHHQMGS